MEPPQNEPDMIEEDYEGGFEIGADEMIEEYDEDFEKSDSITGMSAADKKEHEIEYLQLCKEIEDQNKIVDQLKFQLTTSCESTCLTKCELREIRKLRACMESENIKLQCMVRKAIQMQNEYPSRNWGEIPIVTTLEDDVFPRMGNFNIMASLGLVPKDSRGDRKCNDHKACSKRPRKMKALCPAEGDEMGKLFEEMALKDKLIKCLNEKLTALQQEPYYHSRQRNHTRRKQRRGVKDDLDDSITNMQYAVNILKADLESLCKEKDAYEGQNASTTDPIQRKSNELRNLKEDYAQLLVNYASKENQIRELENRVKGYCGAGGRNTTDVDYAELKLLRDKVNEMRDEQNEYTCIIKEQAEQIDDYRNKYLNAQQKVEEQKSMLEKMDMNNKRIEDQIEAEVKRIKAKFKEQLSELSQYPKLLENEQIKLASACKDRDELEDKLRLVCKELKIVKEQVTTKEEKPDCSQKLASCENKLILLQNKFEQLQKEKDVVCEELLRAKLDLDTMRGESAKIIANTKERFEIMKTSMCSRIDILEKELAQCRANAHLSITNREAVIKEMQSQLNTLSYSFDSAQKQIKTLKNHITFLSNDQCIPIKC